MTWTSVGTIINTTTTSLTVNPGTVGNLVLVSVVAESSTVFCNAISGGNCTWTQVGTTFSGTNKLFKIGVFAGTATSTGSATATLSFSGTTPTIRCAGQQFHSTVGSWSLDVQGNLDSTNTSTDPSLTPAASGELYYYYGYNTTSPTAGSTSGYTYQNDANANGMAYNPACSASAQAPVWGNSTQQFGIAVLMKETSGTSHPGTAALSGSGTLTGAGVFAGIAALSGSGTLTGSGSVSLTRGQGVATLTGVGSLVGLGTGTFLQLGPLDGQGTLNATWIGTLVQPPNALDGEGTLQLSGFILKKTGPLSGNGTLSILQATGGLVFASPGAATPYAYPLSSQVFVAAPGSTTWYPLGSIGVVTALTYSYVCPGGADAMSCTVMVPATYRTQLFNPGWQVRITRGGHQVWDGKMDEPVPTTTGWTLTAVGTGNLGQDYLGIYSGIWPAGQPDDAVNEAIARGLPWINTGIGTPSGAWFGQSVDSGAQTITDLLNLVCTRGGLTWYVNSGPGGQPGDDLSVFALPTVVNRLLICTDPAPRTLGGDINTIYLRYQATLDNSSSGGTAATFAITSVQNTQSVAAHQTIETFMDISDAGVLTAAAAQAVGAKVLSVYQRASFAGPFIAHYGQLTNTGGVPIDPGTDQAGTVVKLILADFGYGGEVTPQFPVTFIVGAYSWDDLAQVATITPYQNVDQSLTGLLTLANNDLIPVTVATV